MSNNTHEFIEDADQWFTNGWRFENNQVYSFTTDRKEQNEQTGRVLSIEEFLNSDAVDIKAKRWLKDILGDACDIVIDEDVPYKN